jgi:hypothetical protein
MIARLLVVHLYRLDETSSCMLRLISFDLKFCYCSHAQTKGMWSDHGLATMWANNSITRYRLSGRSQCGYPRGLALDNREIFIDVLDLGVLGLGDISI